MIRDFPAVVAALSSETGVTLGRMFGAEGLACEALLCVRG
jgi:hypothetical protein